jgi:ribosomal protein RSM22 (predicted rRNA methylase)
MNFSRRQWQKLRELRKRFLSSEPNVQSYWDDETLELYDRTLAVRIGWRWDAVLNQLRALQWRPSAKTLLDWGCGSGMAARKVLEAFPHFEQAHLADLSPRAEQYAANRIQTEFPAISVRIGIPESFCLVLSHVVGELDTEAEERLTEIIVRATSVLWVEAGSWELSRKLALWRERLDWPVVAPCTHRQPCGMLALENRAHWCHFFTQPPQETFMSAEWAELANQLEIDHGTLAFSYLVLDRAAPTYVPGVARTIGSTRVYKASAKLQLCDSVGLRDVEVTKRDYPEIWRSLKKGWSPDLVRLEAEGNRVSKWEEPMLGSKEFRLSD